MAHVFCFQVRIFVLGRYAEVKYLAKHTKIARNNGESKLFKLVFVSCVVQLPYTRKVRNESKLSSDVYNFKFQMNFTEYVSSRTGICSLVLRKISLVFTSVINFVEDAWKCFNGFVIKTIGWFVNFHKNYPAKSLFPVTTWLRSQSWWNNTRFWWWPSWLLIALFGENMLNISFCLNCFLVVERRMTLYKTKFHSSSRNIHDHRYALFTYWLFSILQSFIFSSAIFHVNMQIQGTTLEVLCTPFHHNFFMHIR